MDHEIHSIRVEIHSLESATGAGEREPDGCPQNGQDSVSSLPCGALSHSPSAAIVHGRISNARATMDKALVLWRQVAAIADREELRKSKSIKAGSKRPVAQRDEGTDGARSTQLLRDRGHTGSDCQREHSSDTRAAWMYEALSFSSHRKHADGCGELI